MFGQNSYKGKFDFYIKNSQQIMNKIIYKNKDLRIFSLLDELISKTEMIEERVEEFEVRFLKIIYFEQKEICLKIIFRDLWGNNKIKIFIFMLQ